MALEDYYYNIDYEAPLTTDEWGGNSSGGFATAVTIKGFIQYRGGSESNRFSTLNENTRAVLYTDSSIIVHGGRIKSKYIVISADQENGISGIGHHREIELGYEV